MQDEIDTLNRLTVLFLDTAELRVKERKDLNLRYWRETVDGLLNFQNKAVLQGAGSMSVKQMEAHVEAIYEQFHAKRKALAAAEADIQDQKEITEAVDLFDGIENQLGEDKETISTGFKELDAKLKGWRRGEELVVFMGRTGQGKSWMGLKFAFHAALHGERVGIYSGEMLYGILFS